jgi:DNA-binding LacI/PurR family transcriptional regulator
MLKKMIENPTKNITIRDVAKAVGVSHVTVSNVINKTGRVGKSTEQLVLNAIKQMNFHPDKAARTMAKGRSGEIAFVCSFISEAFVSYVLLGFENSLCKLDKYKFNPIYYSTRGVKSVKNHMLEELLYSKKVDALIMLTIKPDKKILTEFKSRGIPVVLIEGYAPQAHTVRVANYRGGFMATDYLIKKGRRKIAIVNGPEKLEAADENPVFQDRFKGYLAALKQHGLHYDPKNSVRLVDFNSENGRKSMDQVKSAGMDIDAVFCAAGDRVAVGMMWRALQLGYRLPDDIAFVGFDDLPIGTTLTPELTTIRQPLEGFGSKAFELAIGTLEGRVKQPQHILLPPELIIRSSV